MTETNTPLHLLKSSVALSCMFALTSIHDVSAQSPVDASNGIDFGTGANDPAMGKSRNSGNLDIGLSSGSALKVYSNGEYYPYMKAGQGNSAYVTAGKWYRIAQTTGGLRANAKFILMDNISGGGHSTAVFRAGMSYGDASSMGFSLLSHTYYGRVAFTQVRILRAGTYSPFYLEVKVARTGWVRYAMADNLASSGWTPVDWQEAASIQSGYAAHVYDINKLFVVGQTKNLFSIGFNNTVDVSGELKVLGSPVVTQATASTMLASQYVGRSPVNAGSIGSLLLEGANGVTGAIPTEGQGTRMMWYPEKAAFRAGGVGGPEGHDDWDDVNIGEYSMALGQNVRASGRNAVAFGYRTDALGDYSIAMGFDSSAVGEYSTAMGLYSKATGYGSVALGSYCNASGGSTFAVGNGTSAGGYASFSTGLYTDANASCSAVMGEGTLSESYASLAIGRWNEGRGSEVGLTGWVGDNQHSVFEVGIGDGGGRSNAITVLQDGSIELGKATSTDQSVPLHILADGSVILSKAQGDISMGAFGN